MAITAEEFASKAGLSITTISRAMNSSSLVPLKTRQRVRNLAREMGYRPSPAARSLRKRTEQNVGVVIATTPGTPSHLFLAEYALFLVHLAGQLEAKDRGLLLATTSEPITPDTAHVQLPRIADQLHADRLVVLAHMWPELAREIKLLELPTVVIDGPSCGLPAVQRDEEDAAEQLVDHLVEQGHRRIAFINHGGGKAHAAYRDVLWPKGYLRAVTRHRLVPMPGWDLYEEWTSAIDRLLALDARPTAMIVYDDVSAIYAIDYLKDRGLRVPEDISIASMLDCGIGQYQPRPITRMARPQAELARTVVRMLVDEESGRDKPVAVIKLAGELIVGQTSDHPELSAHDGRLHH